MKISFRTDGKEVKSIVEQIEKQQITVGSHIQEIILNKRKEEGKEVKNIREYMESQRAYVWEVWRASNLIQSLLLGIPIPEITVYRADDKSQFRKCVDGQQRLTSIYLFTKDQFKLDLSKSIFPTFEIEGEQYTYQDIQGKLFSQLPELLQDIILSYDLRLTTINNCTEEQAEKFFVSMNAGFKALRPAEVRTAAMGMNVRKFFAQVLKSDWVLHTMTEKASRSNTGNEVISQVITLLHNKQATELSKENIDKVIYSFRDTGVPEELQNDMVNICNYLNEATSIWIENKKKEDASKTTKKGKAVSNYSTYRFTCFNKTHIVMLMVSADKAIKNNVPVEVFAKWSRDFFEHQSEDYKAGMADKVIDLKNVELRLWAIDSEINKLEKGEVKKVEIVEQTEQEEVTEEQNISEQSNQDGYFEEEQDLEYQGRGNAELFNEILETIDNVAITEDTSEPEQDVLN